MKTGGKPRSLKQSNSRAVLELLRDGENATVTDIANKIRLSKTTIKKVFDALVQDGLLSVSGKGESTDEGGKKPDLYRLDASFGYTLGIHVTPEEVYLAVANFRAEIVHCEALPVGRERSLDGLVERCAEFVESMTARRKATDGRLLGVVLGLTGLVDSESGVSIHSFFYPDWGRNAPIVDRLRERLGPGFSAPIFVDNTNRYQALAEIKRGSARDCANFIVIDALPEGLGSGIVINGNMLQGHQSISGEIGHMTLWPKDGFPCVCGNRGCFEALVSERRLVALAGERLPRFPESALHPVVQAGSLTLAAICDAAERGDALARELIDDAAGWYVIGLGNIIMMNDPELVLLRGVYTRAGRYFLERVRNGLRNIGLPHVEKSVTVAYSDLSDERGILGGALFVIDSYLDLHVF